MVDISENIREFIRSNLDNKFDFSNVKSRNQLFKQHCETEIGKKAGFDYKKHLTLYLRMLKKVCREKNIPPETFGLSKEKVKFVQTGGEVRSQITPKPKEGTPQGQGQPTTPEQKMPPVPPPEVGVELVKATWKTLVGVLRLKYPKFRKLEEDDLEALGQSWLPVFRKYIESNWLFWGLPLTITAGIMIPRIAAMKPKEEGEEEEEYEEEEEEEKKSSGKESEAYKNWKSGRGSSPV